MASGPYFDKRSGSYSVQWFDGVKWTRTQVYKIAGWKKGSAKPKKTPPETLAAVKTYADKEKAARRVRGAKIADHIDEFLSDYKEGYTLRQSSGSSEQLRQSIRNFLGWAKGASVKRVEDVTPANCQAFLDWRAQQISRKTGNPITPKRLHLERGMLSGAWSRCVKLGLLPENPWKKTEAPGWDRRRKARQIRPSWSPEQFAKIEAIARPWLRDLLVVGTQCGLRIAALIGLEWRDIEWTAPGMEFGQIRVRAELDKIGQGYTVPISTKCHDVLIRRQATDDGKLPNVLRAARGGPLKIDMCQWMIRSACRRAGLARPFSPNHHMRRTFGRWAVLGHLTGRPVPVYVVSAWMGHRSIATTQIYLDLDQETSGNWMADHRPTLKDSGGQTPSS